MATEAQIRAARENIKKAQARWQSMSSRQHARSQPAGRSRAKPGTKGTGNFYRIIVRPKEQFTSFRNQDVGEPGGLQRVAGHRPSGSWDTQAWLISKDHAHVRGSTLIADSQDARDLLKQLGSKPVHEKGDVFTAKDRPDIREDEKPTAAQKRARSANLRKAQAAHRRV